MNSLTEREEMAASSSKTYSHVRSNSFPSNPHPIISQIEGHLIRLGACETSSSSSSSMIQKLSSLQDLYGSIDMLLQLPSTHQTILQTRDEKCVTDLLKGSIRILDLCDISGDSLFQSKESARELQSALRRKRGESEISDEVRKCTATRKMTKKSIEKELRGIRICKNSEKKQDQPASAIVEILRKVEQVSFDVIESSLSFVSGPKLPLKSNLKSLFSKRVINHEDEASRSESERVEDSLISMIRFKANKSDFVSGAENLRKSLVKFDSAMEEVEEKVENLRSRLIRTRVSLLNILNN